MVSLIVKLKHGTGTKDQDEVIAKGRMLKGARKDMETLPKYVHGLAEDACQIQPEEDDE